MCWLSWNLETLIPYNAQGLYWDSLTFTFAMHVDVIAKKIKIHVLYRLNCLKLLLQYSHHFFFSGFSVLKHMMGKFTDKCLFSLFMRNTKKEWAICLTRKFSFGNVARLQCGSEINVLVLKSWMWPVPIVLPHTYHIVHKICIEKDQALSGRPLYTYWCLWLMHSRGLTSARDWNFVFIPFYISFISPTEYVVNQFLVPYFVIKYGFTVWTCSRVLYIHPTTYIHPLSVKIWDWFHIST
jgi:hypothetical protein